MAFEQEVLYTLRRQSNGTIAIAKFDDHHEQPLEIYRIVGFTCDCFQGSRRQYCKHRKIQDEFHKLKEVHGITPAGVFYDYDRNLFYCPDDGEGIPLTGAFNIKEVTQYEAAF